MGFLQPFLQTRHNPASPTYKVGVRCAYHSGAEGHDTNDCWALRRVVENLIEQGKIVLRDEEVPNVTNNPLPAHNNGPLIGMICEDKKFDPSLKAIIAIVDAGKKPKTTSKLEKGEKKVSTVKVEPEENVEKKTMTMVPVRNEVLYIPRGRAEKPQSFEVKRAKPMYVPKGTYVVRRTIQPSRLNEPVVIGRVPQKAMTNPSTVPWNYQRTLVMYKGREVTGELPENTFIGRYSNTQELNNAARKRFLPKKPVSIEEAEVFFQKMKMPDYEVVDQLRKCPEQVSMLSLLMRSAEHQKILLKTLNEAYIPVETSVEQLERMTERFFAVNQRMEIVTGRIRPNKVCVRDFDGIKRDTLREIDLVLTIGPVEFEITFQVLDMDTSYKFLLGRLWIHAEGAVPSTLHQIVKFEYEDREIVVHGEDEQSIYQDPSIPYLESRYHHVLMDEEDAEKTAFTTPWGTYCYRVMPFGLKNAGATYMRAITAIFYDMMHQEIEVYVDDVIVKSKTQDNYIQDLRKFFERLRKYDLKLNPAKCVFGVP
ncbi:uncharacterized protein [Nicotiana sylvestris]|uniref:uncharacterized protein n=1 Tax=Nicotiana sylvestris TaxID=4096 RepID=UPI00388C6427